jgi:hypothetical protein
MGRERLRSYASWTGRILTVAAVGAVALWFVRMQAWRTIDFRDPRFYGVLLGSVLIYGAGVAALGYGWTRWLKSAGEVPFSTAAGVGIYCRSQIAKYIPGNVFHFVARQALGNSLGAPHSALLLASAWESAALVAVACGVAAVGGAWLAQFPRLPRTAGFAVACVCLAAAAPIASRLNRGDRAHRTPARRSLNTVLTLPFYVPFFAGNGLCLALLMSLNRVGGQHSIRVLAGVWSISWLAGYLVPGSPGGLGVREAALVYALSVWCSRSEAVLLATEMRFVSILGDVAVWLASPVVLTGFPLGRTRALEDRLRPPGCSTDRVRIRSAEPHPPEACR